MSSEHTFHQYAPYIRLTVKKNNYTLWLVTFIPQNYNIVEEPTVKTKTKKIQVDVTVQSNGQEPAPHWQAYSYKIPLGELEPSKKAVVKAMVMLENSSNQAKVAMLSGDPEPISSTRMPLNDAEEE
jgi:hypothetical protein